MFTESNAGANVTAHPLDLLLDAFKDDEAMNHTTQKLHAFLEEVMKMHSTSLARGIMADDALPQKCKVAFFLFTWSRIEPAL